MGLGASMLVRRLAEPGLPEAERAFLAELAPAFTELAESAHERLYVEGAASLLRADQEQDVSQLNFLMQMLEHRVTLLGVLREALDERDVYVRIGRENALPELRSLAIVASAYGLPRRRLGTVSVIGPVRMDYGTAIPSVRDAALQLSRFVEDVYDE
jgi:heat-inducible transcriptional repressor